MDDDSTARRRALNRLTTIKLAVQMLERKTELSDVQRRFARTADEAVDGLIRELLGQPRAEGDGAAGRPGPGRGEQAALDRPRGAERSGGRTATPRPTVRPPVAVALLMGVVLAALILLGAALLLQVLWVVLLVGAVVWLNRR